jgi:hypothetical protein
MDLSYATIPICANTFVRLNREQKRRYHVEDPKEPMNELAYESEDLGVDVWTTSGIHSSIYIYIYIYI